MTGQEWNTDPVRSVQCFTQYLANTTGLHRKVFRFMEGSSFVCFGISLWVRPRRSPVFMSANRDACIGGGETHDSPVIKTPLLAVHSESYISLRLPVGSVSKLSTVRATNAFLKDIHLRSNNSRTISACFPWMLGGGFHHPIQLHPGRVGTRLHRYWWRNGL